MVDMASQLGLGGHATETLMRERCDSNGEREGSSKQERGVLGKED